MNGVSLGNNGDLSDSSKNGNSEMKMTGMTRSESDLTPSQRILAASTGELPVGSMEFCLMVSGETLTDVISRALVGPLISFFMSSF